MTVPAGFDPGAAAANDAGPDADANWAEVERARQLVHDLRNPVGAVHMAVQLLQGPLHDGLQHLPGPLRQRVEQVLVALQTSADQLRHLVTGKTAPRVVTDTARPRVEAVPAPRPAAPVAIAELLHRLEILTVTRSALPALLAVEAQPDLTVAVEGPELLRALSNLVENGIEASAAAGTGPGPWTVQVRAYEDAVCVLGDETEIVIDVRNDGDPLPADVVAWLTADRTTSAPKSAKDDGDVHGVGLGVARRVAEQAGGRLVHHRRGGTTIMQIRIPNPVPTA